MFRREGLHEARFEPLHSDLDRRLFLLGQTRRRPQDQERGSARDRQRDAKGRALPEPCRLDPRLAAVDLDDPLDQRQADPGALRRLRVEALEETENLVVVLRIDPAPVVADVEDRRQP